MKDVLGTQINTPCLVAYPTNVNNSSIIQLYVVVDIVENSKNPMDLCYDKNPTVSVYKLAIIKDTGEVLTHFYKRNFDVSKFLVIDPNSIQDETIRRNVLQVLFK